MMLIEHKSRRGPSIWDPLEIELDDFPKTEELREGGSWEFSSESGAQID